MTADKAEQTEQAEQIEHAEQTGPAPAASPEHPLDLAGIGIGPCNLSLAALAHGVRGLSSAHYEQRPAFHWHPGLLIEGATLQVPFLADLVTLADPASPWSFLSYLKAHDRLFPFYFAERFHIERVEYDAYCRWVSEQLAASARRSGPPGTGLHFGHRVDTVRWSDQHALFRLDFTRFGADGTAETTGRAYARHLVVGIGSAPYVPDALRPLVDGVEGAAGAAGAADGPVIHSSDYLDHRDRLSATARVTVVGSGQSGAEVFLDLLRRRSAGREGLHWLTRAAAFAPMEYSKLGLEHFTPDYTRYFHALPEETRDRLVPSQWQLHKAVDHETLAAIHDELYHRTLDGGWPDATLTPGVRVHSARRLPGGHLELGLDHREQGEHAHLSTDAVVLATGYRERSPDALLAPLAPYLRRDAAGRPRVSEDYRLELDEAVSGSVFVQNAERHTHGVGAPDLGMAAHRAATILNAVTGGESFRLPERTAFTTFGLRTGRPEAARRQGARPRPYQRSGSARQTPEGQRAGGS